MDRYLVICALVGSVSMVTQAAWAGPGVSGAPILVQDTSPRAAALGGAYSAATRSLHAMDYNPAGLASLPQAEVLLLHVAGFDGQATESVAVGMPIPDLGALGFHFQYCGQPSIDNQVPGEGVVEVRDFVLGLSVAFPLAQGWEAGLTAKALSSTLGSAEAAALSMDLGLQAALGPAWRLGLVWRHAGEELHYRSVADPLPSVLAAGAQWEAWKDGPHTVTGGMDVEMQWADANPLIRMGAEYQFRQSVALRAGYVHSVNRWVRGLSAGLGFRFQVGSLHLVFDYALLPQSWGQEDFSAENLISVTTQF